MSQYVSLLALEIAEREGWAPNSNEHALRAQALQSDIDTRETEIFRLLHHEGVPGVEHVLSWWSL
jgi:hypothetical protein